MADVHRIHRQTRDHPDCDVCGRPVEVDGRWRHEACRPPPIPLVWCRSCGRYTTGTSATGYRTCDDCAANLDRDAIADVDDAFTEALRKAPR